jgi:hypothetical protein
MNNHLILTKIMDNYIHNTKGSITTFTYCIENNIQKEMYEKLKQENEIKLVILEKQRKVVFDNYLLFDVKI